VPGAVDRTRSLAYFFFKRILDLTLALLGLTLLAPLLLLIAGILFLTCGRPILFSQERVGRHGGRFRLHKFRTLPNSASERADREWSVRAPTRLAEFLRCTGLDELPQLFNVVRGDMSLVGPRPERPYFVKQFQNEQPSYAERHRLHVGITGWAQVNGWRGNTSIRRRLEFDLFYLHHWSLAFDLRILGATLTGFVRSIWDFVRSDAGPRYARIA
jgi:lipopolysaccharide/colanic/teichoic acid biosynthesis glycosyltransferase